jgi:hypothetical protein
MAFTRFHDDPARIKKQIDQSSFSGRYMLNVPGPGESLPFYQDPQLRLQKWGANLRTNTINLESDLRGLTRPLNRDLVEDNNYKTHAVQTGSEIYPVKTPFIEESRATHPAWMFKDLEQSRWESPFLNPLNGLEKGFHENIQTRILEKDYFVPKVPVVNGNQHMEYYLSGKSVCIGRPGTEEICPKTLYVNKIH